VEVSARLKDGEDSVADTVRTIERLLARPWYQFRFPVPLETQYETATQEVRNREIRRSLLANMALNLLCLGLDAMVAPKTFHIGLLVRLGALLVSAFGLLFVRGRFPVWLQTMGAALALLPWMAAASLIGRTAGQPWADRYFMAVGFSLCLNLVVTQFRFGQAACIGVVGIACVDLIVLGGFGVAPRATTPDIPLFVSVLVPVFIGLRYRMEAANRNAFLLSSLNRLNVGNLASANAALTRLAQVDTLTGLFNRRYFDAALARLWTSTAVSGSCLGLLMVDVDHFKAFNDDAGHQAGDRCLEAVAAALRINVRLGLDTVARYGGEEFVAILPNAELSEAQTIAERVRAAVEGLKIPHPRAAFALLTVSVGVASVQPAHSTPDALLRTADQALYRAKFMGRNRVVCLTGDDAASAVQVEAGTDVVYLPSGSL
jgi:diguanylate cyclase (GGDEF)-like protein